MSKPEQMPGHEKLKDGRTSVRLPNEEMGRQARNVQLWVEMERETWAKKIAKLEEQNGLLVEKGPDSTENNLTKILTNVDMKIFT